MGSPLVALASPCVSQLRLNLVAGEVWSPLSPCASRPYRLQELDLILMGPAALVQCCGTSVLLSVTLYHPSITSGAIEEAPVVITTLICPAAAAVTCTSVGNASVPCVALQWSRRTVSGHPLMSRFIFLKFLKQSLKLSSLLLFPSW